MSSELTGIFCGDIIIRSALIEGIADLRRNPYLLPFVFASLKYDELTKKEYGVKEINQGCKWFLKTEIPVAFSARIDKPKFPIVTISQMDSSEQEMTFSDTHYTPQEDSSLFDPALTDPFIPVSYVASTGTMVVPDSVSANLILAPGQLIFDDVGVGHPILTVTDAVTVTIAVGCTASFTRAVIKGATPAQIVTIESVKESETYQIGCHVEGDPTHLIFLHAIVRFILLRYKQTLLEERGFERSTTKSSDFMRNGQFEAENVFSRHITLSGFVQNSWPKAIIQKITGIETVPVVAAVGDTADVTAIENDIGLTDDDAWLASVDGIGLKP